ncbi:hypothetical protein HYFRA_00001799 [Hymenoscyphus fraxineus]|uniref:Heterokaryon incompatibility domain-containing protein n=1 Tax=Hymenoscyphus fraxineus TaxID=746836 RepID=A0A9N9PE49_9HELO|nr:hypothetical protein HYFRA_00001799 [Hymenoscyphus fraxineus]
MSSTMLSNDSLCKLCSHVVSKEVRSSGMETEYDHHPSPEALEKSAQDGCPLCVRLWDSYTHIDQSRWPRIYYRYFKSNDRIYFGLNGQFFASIEMKPTKTFSELPDLTAHTGSMNSRNMASKWFRTCLEEHEICRHTIDQNYSPTRLLDIGSKNAPRLHLYIHDGFPPAPSYATLSHCWGSVPFKQLLIETLTSMTEGIDCDELPRTFREAIDFARHLDIQYIWIDSLCIIQNSVKDWEQESAQMEFVYRNAVCNIAATGAADSRMGCFFDRNPILAQACRVKLVDEDDGDSSLRSYDIIYSGYGSSGEVLGAPLARRAWVAQEQYLSNRTIQCARNQLYWACRERYASECHPDGFPEDVGVPNQKYFTEISPEQTTKSFDSSHDGKKPKKIPGLLKWNRIVMDYSKRLMTKEQDKLVAISGLAKDIEPEVHNYEENSGYLAGLWERFLPHQLLWWIHLPSIGGFVPLKTESYCAPSWSWASFRRAQILFPRTLPQSHSYMIQVLEAATEPKTSNLMGQVSGGHICLRGWLKSFSIQGTEPYDSRFEINGKFLDGARFHLDEGFGLPEDQLKVICLPIITDQIYHEDPKVHVQGLILKPTGKPEEYKRIGYFQIKITHKNSEFFKRPTYPSTSKFPTDGKASYEDVKREMAQRSKSTTGFIPRSSVDLPAQRNKDLEHRTPTWLSWTIFRSCFGNTSTADGTNDDSEAGVESDDVRESVSRGFDYDHYDFNQGWVESIFTLV